MVIAKTDKVRINEEIKAHSVRLISDKGEQVGIVSVEEALEYASRRELDLVEVAPKANPPVCKVMDYGKYKYELKKKEKESKKKQHTIQIKEVRFRPGIEEHDFNTKLNFARKFILDGAKVKLTIFFRGRESLKPEYGEELLLRAAEILSDIAEIENPPKMEGRTMVMFLTSK